MAALIDERVLRQILAENVPETIFYVQPADIITQIRDLGVPSQIYIQVTGRHMLQDRAVAPEISRRLRTVRGAADAHIQQILNAPEFLVQVDRNPA